MEKSPDLKVVPESEKAQGLTEKRKMPRLDLSGEQFRIKQNGKIFSVVNLSVDGMAIRIIDQLDMVMFTAGAQVQGTLNLRHTKYEVSFQVQNIRNQSIGCRFSEISKEVQEALERYLDPKHLGAQLKPMPSSQRGVLWFHGPGGIDVLYWLDHKKSYQKCLFAVFDYFIQADQQGVSTGTMARTNQPSETHGLIRFETMLFVEDLQLDQHKIEVAKKLIMGSKLDHGLKKWTVGRLEGRGSRSRPAKRNKKPTNRSYSTARTPFDAFKLMREKMSHKLDDHLFNALVQIYGGAVDEDASPRAQRQSKKSA